MLARIFGFAGLAVAVATPVLAGEMTADEARRFVVGKVFAFNCFDGTRGAGRILDDGSVAGSIQISGAGPVRHARLPSGTLRVKGQSVCASVKGLFFEPCFNLVKTDEQSFRGSVSGMGFAYCDFTRRSGRVQMASAIRTRFSRPVDLTRPGASRAEEAKAEAKLEAKLETKIEAKPEPKVEARALPPAEAKPIETKPAETARVEPASLKLRPTAD